MGSVLKFLLKLWCLAAKCSKHVDRRGKNDELNTLTKLWFQFQVLRRTKRFLMCPSLACIQDFTGH